MKVVGGFLTVGACGLLMIGTGVGAAYAETDLCISINGDVKVEMGTATCSSLEVERGKPNKAFAKADRAEAIAGVFEGDSGNTARATGTNSFAIAGSYPDPIPFGPDYPPTRRSHNNTAIASGENAGAAATGGDDNMAIASGDNASAFASQYYVDGDSDPGRNTAIATGDNSSAGASRGSGNTVTATGDGATASSYEGWDNTVTANGDDSTAFTSWADGNTVTTEGAESSATAWYGTENAVTAIGDGSEAWAIEGSGNDVTTIGEDSFAIAVWGDGNTVTATSDGCTVSLNGVDDQAATC